MKRKLLNLFLMLSLLISSSSCTLTKALWGDKSYQEIINQFLVGSDGRYVAFISPSYHYVFSDNSGVLKSILSLNQKGVLTIDAKKTHIKLYENNEVKGYLTLSGPFSVLPENDQYILTGLGILPDKNDNVSIKIDLSGRRYMSKYLGHNPAANTNNTYKIDIYYSDSTLVGGVGKAAVTPIAITLDAVLLIGKVAVYPFSENIRRSSR